MTKPFLRWVGGKTQLLPQLLALAPKGFKSYHEPFLGGGALCFALDPMTTFLNDCNPRLINTYQQLAMNSSLVIDRLQQLERSSSCYCVQRTLLNAEDVACLDVEAAARFIFLNKTCFNGLWRENAAGEFNVPYGGDRKSRKFFDAKNLLECSRRLRNGTTISCVDFEHAVRRSCNPGDFVYFDPPYVPLKTTSFVGYTSDGFGYQEQVRLRDLALHLKSMDVHVMISNSDTPSTRQLYAGFELHEVKARRSINSNGADRGKVGELIIR
jgi:DNA adenine methylase